MNPRDVLAVLRLEDGRRWLDAAHDFQRDDALAVLDGPAPYGYLTRSRGCGKTTDLGAVGGSVLAAAEDRLRCYWCAADSDQAALAIDTIGGFCARTPALAERLDVQTRRVVARDSGAELVILPADAPGAWGLTPHWVFVDELANWSDGAAARRLWEAMSSAVAKRPDARLVLLTTASTPDHFAYKVLEHARSSPLWRVSERDGPAPWMSPARLEEQRQRLPAAVFEQLFENRWTPAAGSFLDPDVIATAFVLPGPAGADRGRFFYSAALDLGGVHDRTALAVGHRDGPSVVLDWLATWQGSKRAPVVFGDVEETVVDAHGSYGFRLWFDRWQALDLTQRLTARGVLAVEYGFTAQSKMRLAQTLLSLINGHNLKLYEADGLRRELLGLRLVQASGGAWAFDHRPGGHDDRAIAIAMMACAALEGPAGGVSDYRPQISGPRPITAGLREVQF